jgi:hypothetical protein
VHLLVINNQSNSTSHAVTTRLKSINTPVGELTDEGELILIYLSTAIGLTPGGSTHLHINNTQNITINNKT